MKGVIIGLLSIACTSPQDGATPIMKLPGVTALSDVVSADDRTWFLFGPERTSGERSSTVCLLVRRDLTCATVPASKHGVRLIEPGTGAAALLAIPIENDTLYFEPFTWKTVRRLEGVKYDQHAVVLRDGTMWIETNDNLLVVPSGGSPKRWFEEASREISISPRGVAWSEWDPTVQKSRVWTAVIEGERLGVPRMRLGIERWNLGRGIGICHTGCTIGLIEIDSRDLVRMDLEGDHVSRIHVGEGMYVRCGPGAVAATPLTHSYGDLPRVSWCDDRGCRSYSTRLPVPFYTGVFTVIDRHVLAVASSFATLEDMLVTWKIGDHVRRFDYPQDYFGGLEGASLPDGGAFVLSEHGRLVVFDRQGRIQPVKLTWWGMPYEPT